MDSDDAGAGPVGRGLGPLVERLLRYSDIRRNDPRENREALRDLIVGELADELHAVRKAERDRWAMLLAGASRIAEDNIKRADDCGMLSRALFDALRVLRAERRAKRETPE